MPKLLTSEEILAVFKVSPRTLRRWVRDGSFPKPVRTGKAKRWFEQDVADYLARQREAA